MKLEFSVWRVTSSQELPLGLGLGPSQLSESTEFCQKHRDFWAWELEGGLVGGREYDTAPRDSYKRDTLYLMMHNDGLPADIKACSGL